MEKLGELEKKGATVDLDAKQIQQLELWNHPAVLGLMAAVGLSVLANVVLLVFLLTKK
jgi:hypothetical protein